MSKWISTKDKLPKSSKQVLIAFRILGELMYSTGNFISQTCDNSPQIWLIHDYCHYGYKDNAVEYWQEIKFISE